MSMICGVHQGEMTLKPGGVSKKTGKPYNAFWACNEKGADGSFCKYKPPNPTSPVQKFNQQLETSGATMDFQKQDEKKGDAMGRNNIAHAMIRAGYKPTLENLQMAETFFRWSRGEMPLIAPQKIKENKIETYEGNPSDGEVGY